MTTRGAYQSIGLIFVLVLTCVCLPACKSKPKITDKDVEVIDDVTLVELLEGKERVTIVDARQDYRYRLGHIPDAINIPLAELKPTDFRFVKGQQVVVYGDSSRNTLSHAAAKKLLAGGNLVVFDFRGGLEMWKRADREVVTGY